MATDRKKGHFTFRTAAVLSIASALLELLAMPSGVPLLGEIRSGIAGGIYHVVYAALFLALGWGLWNAAPWGYKLVFATAVVYTLDKLQLLLNRQAMEAFIQVQMAGLEGQLQAQGIDEKLIGQAIILMAIVVVSCWWGFAFYAYWRRDYFQRDGSRPP